jgi:hypothetical protein
MPNEVLMMRADLQQYLHEFDASVRSLQLLLARSHLHHTVIAVRTKGTRCASMHAK